jgi:hypothetical protein
VHRVLLRRRALLTVPAMRKLQRAVMMVDLSWSGQGLSLQRSVRGRRRWRVARRARFQPPRLLPLPKAPVLLRLRLSTLLLLRRALRQLRRPSVQPGLAVAHRGLQRHRLLPRCRLRARLQRRTVTWQCCASLWPMRALALSRLNRLWPTSALHLRAPNRLAQSLPLRARQQQQLQWPSATRR